MILTFPTRYLLGCALGVFVFALAVAATPSHANVRNSFQPAHVYFGDVQAGQHPNRLAILHNGTGRVQRIATIGVSGSGGYVFTLSRNTALLAASGLPTCRVGESLPVGARCAVDVRVHTVRPGWWRSVLRVTYAGGVFNSAELRAHVIA